MNEINWNRISLQKNKNRQCAQRIERIGAVIPKTKIRFSNHTVEFEMHQFRSVQKCSREPDLFSHHSSSHTINYAQSRTIGNRFMCSYFRLSSRRDVYVFVFILWIYKTFSLRHACSPYDRMCSANGIFPFWLKKRFMDSFLIACFLIGIQNFRWKLMCVRLAIAFGDWKEKRVLKTDRINWRHLPRPMTKGW